MGGGASVLSWLSRGRRAGMSSSCLSGVAWGLTQVLAPWGLCYVATDRRRQTHLSGAVSSCHC